MDKKLKIGIDIHGVIDKYPFFKEMAKCMLAGGHEIHIITGTTFTKAKNDLRSIGMVSTINYTNIFSVTDKLIANNIPVKWKTPNDPIFPDDIWNKAKADYCTANNIDIHFDDSDIYGLYFTTPYTKVK